ncbi:unnamed protein product, partial [Brassica oleracea]
LRHFSSSIALKLHQQIISDLVKDSNGGLVIFSPLPREDQTVENIRL